MKKLLEPKVAIAILGPMFEDDFGLKKTDVNYTPFAEKLTNLLKFKQYDIDQFIPINTAREILDDLEELFSQTHFNIIAEKHPESIIWESIHLVHKGDLSFTNHKDAFKYCIDNKISFHHIQKSYCRPELEYQRIIGIIGES